LTRDADLNVIRQDSLINHAFIWGDVNFNPLLTSIWRDISIHSRHQQRCENCVQMAALIANALVDKARRTQRVIAAPAITRQFNLKSMKIRKEAVIDKKKRDNMKRVSGRHRTLSCSLIF